MRHVDLRRVLVMNEHFALPPVGQALDLPLVDWLVQREAQGLVKHPSGASAEANRDARVKTGTVGNLGSTVLRNVDDEDKRHTSNATCGQVRRCFYKKNNP